jgi:hypothetical protein
MQHIGIKNNIPFKGDLGLNAQGIGLAPIMVDK